MKLKDLKKRDGSGAWPEQAPKLYDKDDQHMNISGYEDALEELGSLNLCVDVEALAKVVHEEFCYQPYWKSLSNWDKARMAKDKENSVPFKLSEVIAARLSEWLVVEESKDER